MASSDSTGFHDIGWKFHQYSSSGSVLEASSECVLQMNVGAALKGTMTVGSGGVITVEPLGEIRDQAKQNLVGQTDVQISAHGITFIGSVATTSSLNYSIAAPGGNGTKKTIILTGNSSTVITIAASSAAGFAVSQSSENFTATATSGPFGLFSSSALAGGSFKIDLMSTGTSWRIISGLTETVVAATLVETTNLYATT